MNAYLCRGQCNFRPMGRGHHILKVDTVMNGRRHWPNPLRRPSVVSLQQISINIKNIGSSHWRCRPKCINFRFKPWPGSPELSCLGWVGSGVVWVREPIYLTVNGCIGALNCRQSHYRTIIQDPESWILTAQLGTHVSSDRWLIIIITCIIIMMMNLIIELELY